MPTIKFACVKCERTMAVGQELAGHRVRCPHCESVVVAPGAGGTGVAHPSTDPEVHLDVARGDSPRTGIDPPARVAHVRPFAGSLLELPPAEPVVNRPLGGLFAATAPPVEMRMAADRSVRPPRPGGPAPTGGRG